MSTERGTWSGESGDGGGALVCFAVREEAKYFQPTGSASVVVTGIGPRNAERALLSTLTTQRPSLVLTCGFAGGLDPGLRRGEIVFDAADAEWMASPLQQLGARAAKFHCTDRIAVTVADKQVLRQQTNADVVEMESGVIRRLCQERGIAAATVRIISDDAVTPLPLDFNQLAKPDGNISYGRLALVLLDSPATIPKLMRFQRELDVSSKRLGTLLTALTRHRGQLVP